MKILRFVLLTAAICYAPFAHAQFHIGVKAGANINKIAAKSFKDEFSFNYLLGGFAEINFGGRLGLHPEILFSQSSSTLSNDYKDIYNDIISSGQSKAKLNYLSIPILLNAKVAGPLHLEAGPQYSILLNSSKNFLQNGKDAFKSGEFSLAGGIQLQFSRFRLGGRYLIGLDNINKIDNKDEWKNQAIQISLGVAF